MKKFVLIALITLGSYVSAQQNADLKTHYEAFYKEMRLQGDVSGVINALTHLNVLSPSPARRDTLAFVYMNSGQHLQALNTIGIENDPNSSDLAVQVKAISLKNLNQPKRAIEQFELMFQRNQNPFLAYELADLKILTGDKDGAAKNIEYGLANVKDDMKHAFYERQQPYEASLKAAFMHLKGLLTFSVDKEKIDEAIAFVDEALKIDPNFNLASLSRQALESKKTETDATKE